MFNEFTYCSLKNKSFSIPPTRIESFKILSVSFLQEWDLISNGNDTLSFVETGGPVLNARIPHGTYSVASIGEAIAVAMEAVGSQGYDVQYDNVTRKLTISTDGTTDFKILPGNRGTTSYYLLGMDKVGETGYGRSFVLKNAVNLSGSYPVLLTSNIPVRGVRYLSDFNDSAQSVIATIIPDSFGDIVTWVNDGGEFVPVGETVSKIEFFLIDSLTGNEIALNTPLTVRFSFSDDVDDL